MGGAACETALLGQQRSAAKPKPPARRAVYVQYLAVIEILLSAQLKLEVLPHLLEGRAK